MSPKLKAAIDEMIELTEMSFDRCTDFILVSDIERAIKKVRKLILREDC